jgi:type IV pilus assembly protein PilC
MYFVYLTMLVGAFVACLIATWLRLRRQRIGVVAQTLACIVSQNLPLVPAIQAAASSERRALRKIYARLARRLANGEPLSTALRYAMRACPGEVIGPLQGAERGGTLPGVLQSLATRMRRTTWESSQRGVPAWYPLVLLVFLPLVVTFVFVKILPKFEVIFADFGTQLPPLTIALYAVARVVCDYAAVIGLFLVLALLALVHVWVGRHYLPRRPGRWQPVYAFWDSCVWIMPGLRHLARTHALTQQLLIMQAALRAGHNLDEAAEQGTSAAVNWHARRRLQQWATQLREGRAPLDAARQLGFPAPFLRALSAVGAPGELAARFEYLTEYYQALQRHWRHVTASVVTPAMVVAWALLIGFIVVALFLPLTTLIQSVANAT